MLAADGIVHGLAEDASQPLRGPAGFLPFHAQFREAFPNIEVVVEDQIGEGDMVATRCSVRGKHEGDSLGFKATQARVEFTGMVITRMKDGKIVEAWNNFDFMKMYKQLGAI
jgi:predicted ester cyclase